MDVNMEGNDKKVELPLLKFRLPTTQRLSNILRPDAVDGELRRKVVRNITGDVAPVRDDRRSPNKSVVPFKRLSQEGNYPATLRDQVCSGDGDLLGAMAKRLKTLEAQQNAYRMELKEKTEKLLSVEASYKNEKKRREEAEATIVEIYEDKEELEKLVGEMRDFLSDYGLEWVGDKGTEKRKNKGANSGVHGSAENAKGKNSPSAPNATSQHFEMYKGNYEDTTPVLSPFLVPFTDPTNENGVQDDTTNGKMVSFTTNSAPVLPVSMEILKRNAKILSDHVGSRGVFTNGKQGGIKENEVVRIVVYQDGICVNSGPFRPFGWPLCDAVLNDLAEGFYPYEFKERFPNGFPIEIIDQTSVCFSKNKAGDNSAVKVKDLRSLKEGKSCQPVSREEFLKRLPATRITESGRIVRVREAIERIVGRPTGTGNLRHVSEAERKLIGETEETESRSGGAAVMPNRVKGLVAVLVRFPSGEKVSLNLAPENTIADLRREIQLAVPGFKTAYDLHSSFPSVTYTDDTKTLRELGLLTSCTLMIQPRRNA
ncbi:hypothetical protein MOQ_003511 [Trypanosoma cruzi marinkellei]|uniref:UBX domain-containing protein 11 n=1 Tax=Trypanosoma cruzi marinkellei TaxID=85056 RepID=K2N016_TRYCR|nr:hypothetical protein MOQ_003511 [Trypanosoma cruzi marinkellei]